MFKYFFETVESVTGRKLNICALSRDFSHGLLSILLDADAGQALGLGQFLLSQNNPDISGIFTEDPYEIITYILQTCFFHFAKYGLFWVLTDEIKTYMFTAI
jgi:hypothetical protein